jgi:hypothetical protein
MVCERAHSVVPFLAGLVCKIEHYLPPMCCGLELGCSSSGVQMAYVGGVAPGAMIYGNLTAKAARVSAPDVFPPLRKTHSHMLGHCFARPLAHSLGPQCAAYCS